MKRDIAFKFLGVKPLPLVITLHIHVTFRDPCFSGIDETFFKQAMAAGGISTAALTSVTNPEVFSSIAGQQNSATELFRYCTQIQSIFLGYQ